jgi:MtN3 and saliva related transmembrane protein
MVEGPREGTRDGRLDACRFGIRRGGVLFPLKAWRSADREAISKRTYLVASAAYALWIVHGVMIGSVPIIVFNALALLLGLAILVLKLRDPTIPRHG